MSVLINNQPYEPIIWNLKREVRRNNKQTNENYKSMKSLKKQITELKFDWVNSDIEKHFTLEPIRSTDFVLYYPDKNVSSQEVEHYATDNKLEVANLAELLAYAKDGWNNQDLVVALGSSAVIDGGRRVPCLYRGVVLRSLYLDWDGNDFGRLCRFLLVRKGNLDSGTLGTPALSPLESRVEELENFKRKVEAIIKL